MGPIFDLKGHICTNKCFTFSVYTQMLMNSFEFHTHQRELGVYCLFTHFSHGPYSYSLLTRLRVGRSDLNWHKFSIGLTDEPECICQAKSESTMHYFWIAFCMLLSIRHCFAWFKPQLAIKWLYKLRLRLLSLKLNNYKSWTDIGRGPKIKPFLFFGPIPEPNAKTNFDGQWL